MKKFCQKNFTTLSRLCPWNNRKKTESGDDLLCVYACCLAKNDRWFSR